MVWSLIKKSTFAKFCTGGIVVFSFEYILTLFLVEILGFSVRPSYALSLLIGIVVLYYYQKKITFDLHHECYKMFSKFVFTMGLIYIVNFLITSYLINWIVYYLAIPIVASIMSLFGYLVNKNVVFKKKVICKDF